MDTILAPLLAEQTLEYVEKYTSLEGNDVADLLLEFTEYERLVITGLDGIVNRMHPYNRMAIMELITDCSRSKIKRIIYKK